MLLTSDVRYQLHGRRGLLLQTLSVETLESKKVRSTIFEHSRLSIIFCSFLLLKLNVSTSEGCSLMNGSHTVESPKPSSIISSSPFLEVSHTFNLKPC